MGWLNDYLVKGFRGFSSPVSPSSVPTNPLTGGHFFSAIPAGPAQYFDLNNSGGNIDLFNNCGPVKAIIARRAQMFCNGEIQLVNTNSQRQARGAGAKSISELLARPNVLQSWGQFWAQVNVYVDLFGYCPIFKTLAAGMELLGQEAPPSNLWCIPPQLLEIEFTGKWRSQTELKNVIKSYKIKGEKEALPFDQVALILDNAIGTAELKNDSSFLLPDSRLKGLEVQASNLRAIGKAINTLVTKRGALGIFSNGAKDSIGHIKIDPEERDRMQQEFSRYGITGQEWQFIITDANLNWQSTTFPIKDFDFPELEQSAFSDLCNGIGIYEYILSGKNGKGTTFANLKEAKAAQYQDYIIPDAANRLEQLSRFIVPPSQSAALWIDFSKVEALQQSRKEYAEALKATGEAYKLLWELGLVTRNDMLEAMDRDTVERDEFNLFIFELQTVNNGQTENNAGNGAEIEGGQEEQDNQ